MKEKKIYSINKKPFLLSFAVLFLIAAIALLNANLKDGVTGSSVQVEYYGISDQVFSAETGKIQTYLVLKQPILNELGKIQESYETALEIAEDIVEVANFAPDIVRLYQNDPLMTIDGDDLEKITLGAEKEADDFKKETICLKRIGDNYDHEDNLRLVLVSELRSQICKNAEWRSVWMKHNFYRLDEGRFICSQEGEKLFLIKDTGLVSTDTALCDE